MEKIILDFSGGAASNTSSDRQHGYDNPEYDATDFAHPAWFRGSDYSIKMMCRLIHEWIDNPKDRLGLYSAHEINDAKSRVMKLSEAYNFSSIMVTILALLCIVSVPYTVMSLLGVI
jgi:hypothetical protein